jgi:MoxR-like ATPase
MVTSLSRATAFLRGRDFVIPEDVQFIWLDAVAHRLLLPVGAAGRSEETGQVAGEVLRSVQPPRIR